MKLYDFTILAEGGGGGVEPNKFVILIRSHNGAIMGQCLIELMTAFELEQVISMQFRKKKRLLLDVVWNVRIHHLSLLNTTEAQSAVVLSLEVADGVVKTTLKQLGKQFNSFYMASDLFLNIWSLWNTELQRLNAGKPVSVLRGLAEKNVAPASFLHGSLFSTCLDCFFISY